MHNPAAVAVYGANHHYKALYSMLFHVAVKCTQITFAHTKNPNYSKNTTKKPLNQQHPLKVRCKQREMEIQDYGGVQVTYEPEKDLSAD